MCTNGSNGSSRSKNKKENNSIKIKKIPSHGCGKSGPISLRTNKLSLFQKKWTEGHYWLHVYPATIHIFDNKEQMDHWIALYDANNTLQEQQQQHQQEPHDDDDGDYGHQIDDSNSSKSIFTNELNKIWKTSINFDSNGELKKILKDPEKKECCDDVGIPIQYMMEEVRSKYYTKNGPLMHTCKISFSSFMGKKVHNTFGSSDPIELKRLRAVIRGILRVTKKASSNKRIDDSSRSIRRRRNKKNINVTDGFDSSGSMSGKHTLQSEVTATSKQ
mmetsp:Transcript_21837/g.25243  ORF Transcript_21837/g.25243 Transcript_21837/m.25243 type:complete len:274 (-) Transcript_21837:77-898(-)